MRRTLYALLALLMLVAAACGGSDTTSQSPTAPTTTDATEDCLDASSEAEVTITMGDNFFDPECLTVFTTATLDLVNEGSAAHTFTIPDSEIDVEVNPGESGTYEAAVVRRFGSPNAAGEYVFYCRFHGSPGGGSGMSGTITIV